MELLTLTKGVLYQLSYMSKTNTRPPSMTQRQQNFIHRPKCPIWALASCEAIASVFTHPTELHEQNKHSWSG